MECGDVFRVCVSIPFPTPRQAEIAYDVLRVDAEPKRSGVSKKLSLDLNIFKIEFAAVEVRQIRVAVHSFMEFLVLVTQTMDQFGPPRSDKYSHMNAMEKQEEETQRSLWKNLSLLLISISMPEHSPAPTPSRAVYGFAFHLASRTAFALYLLWGFVLPMLPPSVASLPYISQLPQPYWAVAIPIHACVALATFAFLIYPGINLSMTPAPNDMRTIRDCHSRDLPSKSKHSKGIPPVADLDISHVCRTLYLKDDM